MDGQQTGKDMDFVDGWPVAGCLLNAVESCGWFGHTSVDQKGNKGGRGWTTFDACLVD
jgi:hypothetical protein